MELTPETVDAERDRLRERAAVVVPLINGTRAHLGELFATDVDEVTPEQYRREVDVVFADGDVAVNVAGYAGLLRSLDVAGDYPGFVVDEVLGRRLAACIAGGQPLSVLAEATFHVADARTGHGDRVVANDRDGADDEGDTADDEGDTADDYDRDVAGADDLDAALAAGFQTRLPGWDWTEGESPFGVDPE